MKRFEDDHPEVVEEFGLHRFKVGGARRVPTHYKPFGKRSRGGRGGGRGSGRVAGCSGARGGGARGGGRGAASRGRGMYARARRSPSDDDDDDDDDGGRPYYRAAHQPASRRKPGYVPRYPGEDDDDGRVVASSRKGARASAGGGGGNSVDEASSATDPLATFPRILDSRRRGRGMQYLVHSRPSLPARWLAGSTLTGRRDRAMVERFERGTSGGGGPEDGVDKEPAASVGDKRARSASAS